MIVNITLYGSVYVSISCFISLRLAAKEKLNDCKMCGVTCQLFSLSVHRFTFEETEKIIRFNVSLSEAHC